ncbi:MAG: hypothetical protein OSB00_03440 [Sphingomonas bacterium]|nr:hypothetical protein [Sphingomonas bacterium]
MTKTTDRVKEATNGAASRAGETIDANPLAILASGLAIGALAGALLPRSDKEKELLAPIGNELAARAKAATAAARDAGQNELSDRGLTKDAAKDQAKSLFQGIVKAATTAGSAAAKQATTKA